LVSEPAIVAEGVTWARRSCPCGHGVRVQRRFSSGQGPVDMAFYAASHPAAARPGTWARERLV